MTSVPKGTGGGGCGAVKGWSRTPMNIRSMRRSNPRFLKATSPASTPTVTLRTEALVVSAERWQALQPTPEPGGSPTTVGGGIGFSKRSMPRRMSARGTPRDPPAAGGGGGGHPARRPACGERDGGAFSCEAVDHRIEQGGVGGGEVSRRVEGARGHV